MTKETWHQFSLRWLAALASICVLPAWTFGSQAGKTAREVATEVMTLPTDEDIRGLDFNPDGNLLATTSTQVADVRIWDWRNKRLARTFERAQGSNLLSTEPVRFGPDGRLLAVCHGPSGPNKSVVRIWNSEPGDVVHDIEEPSNGGRRAIAFTADGRSLIRILRRPAQAPEDTLVVHDTKTWQPMWGLHTTPFYPTDLAISPDGKFAAVAGRVINPERWPFNTARPTFGTPPVRDQSLVVIVDLGAHAIVRTLQASAERVDWNPDNVHLVAASGLETTVFDARSGEIVATE